MTGGVVVAQTVKPAELREMCVMIAWVKLFVLYVCFVSLLLHFFVSPSVY